MTVDIPGDKSCIAVARTVNIVHVPIDGLTVQYATRGMEARFVWNNRRPWNMCASDTLSMLHLCKRRISGRSTCSTKLPGTVLIHGWKTGPCDLMLVHVHVLRMSYAVIDRRERYTMWMSNAAANLEYVRFRSDPRQSARKISHTSKRCPVNNLSHHQQSLWLFLVDTYVDKLDNNISQCKGLS